MTEKRFDIDNSLTVPVKFALISTGDRRIRQSLRQSSLDVLEFAHKRGLKHDEATFSNILSGMAHTLADEQQSLVISMCLDASAAYKEWYAESQAISRQRRPKKSINYGASHLHGGSGHTGRLRVGSGAPNGTESFQSDDDPREGLARWVGKLTAAGAGVGFSLSELAGQPAKQRKRDNVIPLADLAEMSKQDILNLMDTAIDPANFLRAMLSYYGKPMIFSYRNITVIPHQINSPKSIESVLQLDTIYRFMREIDEGRILEPIRAARFLLLCRDVLDEVHIPDSKKSAPHNKETNEERQRSLRLVKVEITDELKKALNQARITEGSIRINLQDDARRMDEARRNAPHRPYGSGIMPVGTYPVLGNEDI